MLKIQRENSKGSNIYDHIEYSFGKESGKDKDTSMFWMELGMIRGQLTNDDMILFDKVISTILWACVIHTYDHHDKIKIVQIGDEQKKEDSVKKESYFG